ncbi:Ppx/GppA phosphatase family protein [Leptolyngbya sp. FACHB-261]|uniref:Ppx/GppA phosphatase family protein n=1 Tax=Leptolyngbya sp. FACHB-261 TaxID=2692806 RepID=UPI0016822818|nr:Ppx/GppA phosphatase family protein [Leptolyngbya sp. FACHB-261]MBD2104997.1 Ppx/GppA family phosphatase [Leptolyngbya sp. FACHB-261]
MPVNVPNYPPFPVAPILAAIDIGTNSIHMVVVRIQPDLPAFTIIGREKETVRLGEREQQTGRLTPVAMARGLEALRRCQSIAQAQGAGEIIAVATSAVREAPNGRQYLQQIEQELGIEVDLISGPEEARRIYLGVLSGLEFGNLPHVIIDIGGGSTELILGDGREARFLSSTKVGAVRLNEQFVHSDPIRSEDYERLRAYVRGMLERPAEDLRSHLTPAETGCLRMVGTSGTIQALALLLAREKLGTVPLPLSGYEFSLSELEGVLERLQRLNLRERRNLPGLSERRSEIILAGATVLHEAMLLLGTSSVVVCERALREGLVVDWMMAHGLIADYLRYQESVRERSVIRMAQRYQVNVDHSEHVADLVLTLFDQLNGVLHDWGSPTTEGLPWRELLKAAAILHNCGHYISHSAHHKHSYYLIRHGELLGYTEAEIEVIANLARYHRKGTPKKKHESYLTLTHKQHRRFVDQASALLRLAVALDRRQLGAVERIWLEYDAEARLLHLYIQPAQADDPCDLELWSLDFKKEAFETEYGVKLVSHRASAQAGLLTTAAP